MRTSGRNGALSVRAIAGTHVVTLAWDIEQAAVAAFGSDLLGFAIEREERDPAGAVVERYWLRGMKRFEGKDEGVEPGTLLPTSEHPVQSFQWGDYTVKPGRTYQYRLVPARGRPKLLSLVDAEAAAVTVQTEPERVGMHSVYFNRGVAGSQAYVRKFGETKPNQDDPDSRQMQWLSRGLYEALTAFIGEAKDARYALYGALYEFHYLPVVERIKTCIDNGVDVRIIYDDPSYGTENRAALKKAGIEKANAKPRNGSEAQKHNKFLILIEDGHPVAVWTGSTNLSAGGIFGHSNVGHAVYDPAIADAYLTYWRNLWEDPELSGKAMRAQASATPTGKPEPGTSPLFSPRATETLDWYAERMREAQSLACFTVAFTIDARFKSVLAEDTDVLRYVLCDKGGDNVKVSRDKDVVIAVGAKLDEGDLPGWRGEVLTGLNKNQYIHDKFMLLDPLSDDPIVVTGSANFSVASQRDNDENMLLIRGDTRVADIYFGEFMRLFDHLYMRWVVKTAGENPDRGFLWDDNRWIAEHFSPGPKSRRRQAFMVNSGQ